MKEELISFETAKLAKEKGFSYPVRYCYTSNGFHEVYNMNIPENMNLESINRQRVYNAEWYMSAPTQSLLQKWLREEHRIFINITFDLEDGNDEYSVEILTTDRKNINWGYCTFRKTYEEALEAGLIEALKLIK